MVHNSIVVAITGASGSAYVLRLLQVLLQQQQVVNLVVSEAGRQVMQQETGLSFPSDAASELDWKSLIAGGFSDKVANSWGFGPLRPGQLTGILRVHQLRDFSAGIASGSYQTRGMVICPCSTGTLSAIATGASNNLIHRVADVHLKERRKLILVPRETPLSRITLSNMLTLTDAGAIILPAMPGYYHQPQSIADLVDFVVARICDQLEIPHQLSRRWGKDS
jgi:4-hydroxy-3-polyprenylbenzoate decarboxylase